MTTSTKVNNSPEFSDEEIFFARPLMIVSYENYITYSHGPCEQEFTRSQLEYLKDKIEKTIESYDKLNITDEQVEIANTQILDELFTKARNSTPEKKKKQPREGYIYLIQNTVNKALKIGFSKNPKSRLQQLNNASPDPLEMICYRKGTLDMEQSIHNDLRDLRLNTEWYPDEEVVYTYF